VFELESRRSEMITITHSILALKEHEFWLHSFLLVAYLLASQRPKICTSGLFARGYSSLSGFWVVYQWLDLHQAMPLSLIKNTDPLTLVSQLGEDHQTRKDACLEKTSP